MRPDLRLHAIGGLLIGLYVLGTLALHHHLGLPLTIAIAGFVALLGFEWYQKLHDNGVPAWDDVLAGFAPIAALALGLHLFAPNLLR